MAVRMCFPSAVGRFNTFNSPQEQNISTLDLGLDLNSSTDNVAKSVEDKQIGETAEPDSTFPFIRGNDPNLASAGDYSQLIDASHIKRTKFDSSLDPDKISNILFNSIS